MQTPRTTSITVAQLSLSVGNPDANRSAMQQAVRSAHQGIVVMPELVASGYCFRDSAEARALAEPLDGPTTRCMQQLARETGSTLIASFAELDGEHLFNTAVVIAPSGLLGTYRKVHLWGRESQHFTPGNAPPAMINTPYGRLGIMICYDLEFPEWIRMAALSGADLICASVNWPLSARPADERPIEQITVQAAAAASRVPIAVADRCGRERMEEDIGSDWVGGSIIVGVNGYPLTEPALGRAAILSTQINLAATQNKRWAEWNDAFKDRRPHLYKLE